MEAKYAFIVGCDRTGTTLLVSILNKHTEIYITNQTSYMGHLVRPGFREKMAEFGDLSDDDNVRRLVEFMYGRPFAGGAFWRRLKANVIPEDMCQKILASDRSERAIFSVLMQVGANQESILGEKTPDHIKYVPLLLEWFPDAKIIHTFRDVRAVYVSEFYHRWNQANLRPFPYQKLRFCPFLFKLFILLHMSLEWFLAARYHFKYQKRYPQNYYLLKFEDLISDPEKQIAELCKFLGVDFEAQMLEQQVINTGFKVKPGHSGFDRETINRWRKHIEPWARIWFRLWSMKYLKFFGYDW